MKGDTVMVLKPENFLEKLYDEYADLLYRIALTHSQNQHDAMDAVQDVFLKVASLNKAFSDKNYEKAWLIRLVINRCHDLSRKIRIRQYTPLDEVYDFPDDESKLSPNVREMLDGLPEKFKTVLVLHYLEGFSVEETADILKLSVSAVKMRLSRARDFVKDTYKKEEFYD